MKIKLKDVENFNEMRVKKGLTKTDLAEAIKISAQRTILICNGSVDCGVKVAKRICETLEVGFDDVFKIVKTEQTRAEPEAVAK